MKFRPLMLNLYRLQYRSLYSTRNLNDKEYEEKLPFKRLTKLYCTPTLGDEEIKGIENIVGIQLGLSYLSWAKINTQEHILSDLNFQILPDSINKMELNQIYSTVFETIQNLPIADYYVMEELPRMIAGRGGKLYVTLAVTRIQLAAMLVGLLNYRTTAKQPKVIFLKQHVSARLFQLLVGSEQISSISVVSKLISGETYPPFTSIKVDSNVLSYYNQSKNVEKEMLGQAFLIALAFTNMIINKNEECFKILWDSNKRS